LARLVAEGETLAAMMATRNCSLLVAGEVIKHQHPPRPSRISRNEGSDDAAGGLLMFRSGWHTESGNVTLIGVVLGQKGHKLSQCGDLMRLSHP
jgi:hypothetical protein